MLPGAREILEWSNKKGYPTVLVTSSSRNYADQITTQFGIRHLFKAFVTAEDVQNGKPDPEPYKTGARLSGCAPSTCFAFEDSINGVISAKSAGTSVFAVPSMGIDHSLIQEADHIVGSLLEAKHILENMGL